MAYPTENLNLPIENVEAVYITDGSPGDVSENSHQVHHDTFMLKQTGSSVKCEVKNTPQGSLLDTLRRPYPGYPLKQTPANAEQTVNAYDNCHTAPNQQYNFPFVANVFPQGPFTCLVCQKTFSKSNFLRMHISIFHSEPEPLVNEFSHQNSTATQTKDETKKTKEVEPLHQCDICKKPFTLSVLKQHMRMYHGKNYTCTFCEETFAKKSNLAAHKALHTGDKPFMCNICPKSFRQKTNLKLHLATHTDTRSFACDICQKSFKTLRCFQSHMQIHSEQEELAECQVCHKYYGKRNLRHHMRLHKEKSHTCDVCGRSFVLKRYLVEHMRVHTGEKPHPCSLCQKSFGTRFCLKKHMRIHNGEKPFLCDLCGQAFTRKHHLKQHERTHKPLTA